MSRGYFGIGIYNAKTPANIGTLWRSAYILGADFIFTIGKRYPKEAGDTVKAFRHIPLHEYADWEDFKNHIPHDCQPVAVEIDEKSRPLGNFTHPERAVYILGAEDHGIPQELLKGIPTVQIPAVREFCYNVSVAGSLLLYDRQFNESKSKKGE